MTDAYKKKLIVLADEIEILAKKATFDSRFMDNPRLWAKITYLIGYILALKEVSK